MSAIKSALGLPSEHGKTQTSISTGPGGLHAVPAAPSEPQFEQLIHVLHQLAEYASKQEEFQKVVATYAVEIKANADVGLTVHLCFDNGTVELVRGNCGKTPDVTLSLSADDLTLILCGKESPMQVYMGGRIKVLGDWACLRRFIGVIDKCAMP